MNLIKKKNNTFNKFIKNFNYRYFSDKIDNYYKFMEDNIQKNRKNQISKIIDDPHVLEEILKCPMTDSPLKISKEGLQIMVN